MPHVGSVQSKNRRLGTDFLDCEHAAHASFAGLVLESGAAAAAVAAGTSAGAAAAAAVGAAASSGCFVFADPACAAADALMPLPHVCLACFPLHAAHVEGVGATPVSLPPWLTCVDIRGRTDIIH